MTNMVPEEYQQSWTDAIYKIITMESNTASIRTSRNTLVDILKHMHRKALSRTSDERVDLPEVVIDLTVQCVEIVAKQPAMMVAGTDQDLPGAMEVDVERCAEADVDRIYNAVQDLERQQGMFYN